MRNQYEHSPLVSIITPTFNQGDFIEEAILSVKNQEYKNIEHIIVDGASNDNTVDILRRYDGEYAMRWISEPDKGQSDAVNKGISMARGEIIGWLNSDDVYFDTKVISRVVRCFQDRPEVDIVYGDCAYIGKDGTILRIQHLPSYSYNKLLSWCFLEQPAVFFRQHVLRSNVLNPNMKLAVDYEYWLRVGNTYRFYHISSVLAADRNHDRRFSVKEKEKLRKIGDDLRRQYANALDKRHSILLYLNRQVEKIYSGIPRRLRGIYTIYSLKQKDDFAFKANIRLNIRTLRYQLFPPSLDKMRP